MGQSRDVTDFCLLCTAALAAARVAMERTENRMFSGEDDYDRYNECDVERGEEAAMEDGEGFLVLNRVHAVIASVIP